MGALSSFPILGFSGSRSVVPPVLTPVVSAAVRSGLPVWVGCAAGVDFAVRSGVGSGALRVFSVGAGGCAARSVRFVRALAGAEGVLFSFPSSACPAGLLPSASSSRAFCGAGSGSWASLALAIGLGVPCFVWLPVGVSAPVGWGLVGVGGEWLAVGAGAAQLSLL